MMEIENIYDPEMDVHPYAYVAECIKETTTIFNRTHLKMVRVFFVVIVIYRDTQFRIAVQRLMTSPWLIKCVVSGKLW